MGCIKLRTQPVNLFLLRSCTQPHLAGQRRQVGLLVLLRNPVFSRIVPLIGIPKLGRAHLPVLGKVRRGCRSWTVLRLLCLSTTTKSLFDKGGHQSSSRSLRRAMVNRSSGVGSGEMSNRGGASMGDAISTGAAGWSRADRGMKFCSKFTDMDS